MNPDDLPHPVLLEKLAEEQPIKVPLRDYRGAMEALRKKRYSYAEIAEWMSAQLGIEVTRSQVAYVVNADPAVHQLEDMEEKEEDEQDRMDEYNAKNP